MRCGACLGVVCSPAAMVAGLTVQRLGDGRLRWIARDFYGVIIHECPPADVVVDAEAIVRAAFAGITAP